MGKNNTTKSGTENKRFSLTTQLVLAMLLLVGGLIVLCVFFNNTFLEDYYRYHKQEKLIDGYRAIEEARAREVLSDQDFDVEFDRLCTNDSMDILIYKQNEGGTDMVIRSSFTQAQLMDMSMAQLREIFYGVSDDRSEKINEEENYVILRQSDRRIKTEYMVLAGALSDKKTGIYMRTAVEPIRESAEITNRFFFMVGLIGLFIELFIIVFAAKGISRPIRKLTDNSIHMTNLEFDVKFHSGKHTARELDILGRHMNELSETLERTISELKVANNELLSDIEKREKLDEMRKEFLSNVSHELKTPLALIQGYAEGLRDGIAEDAESTEFYADVIVDEAGKMNHMVKKLLTLNQLEFGNEAPDMSRFNITELIRGVVKANRLLLDNEGISLTFDEADKVYVWGDEFKVEEIITNYLSNAIHYCRNDKKIHIFYEIRGKLLRISVFNTGEQIPGEDLDKVWIKFYKVDKARTREYGGNGIGLSIVKAIMDSFHQECGVKNHPDGVEFWMELEHAN